MRCYILDNSSGDHFTNEAVQETKQETILLEDNYI